MKLIFNSITDMKKLIVLAGAWLIFLSLTLHLDAKGTLKKTYSPTNLTFNLIYTESDEPPSSIEREIVPDLKKLLKKPLISFGKNLQKKYKVRIKQNVPQNKYEYINGILFIKNIHAEYEHNVYTDDYYSRIKLNIVITIQHDVPIFDRIYQSKGKLHLGREWAEWIGVNKVTRFTLNKIFNKVIDDIEFGEALRSVDKETFVGETSVIEQKTSEEEKQIETKDNEVKPEEKKPAIETKPLSIEDRLRALQDLKDKGLITEEEYKNKRKSLLDEL